MAASARRYRVIVLNRGQIGLVALAVLSLAGCAQESRITRVDTEVVTDLSGRWNDTDSRMVAETMVKEALGSPWLENYTRSKNKQPVVGVGTILNRTHEHSELPPFVTDLPREWTNTPQPN